MFLQGMRINPVTQTRAAAQNPSVHYFIRPDTLRGGWRHQESEDLFPSLLEFGVSPVLLALVNLQAAADKVQTPGWCLVFPLSPRQVSSLWPFPLLLPSSAGCSLLAELSPAALLKPQFPKGTQED